MQWTDSIVRRRAYPVIVARGPSRQLSLWDAVILFSASAHRRHRRTSATSAPPMSPMYGLGLGLRLGLGLGLRVRIDIADVADALNSITDTG